MIITRVQVSATMVNLYCSQNWESEDQCSPIYITAELGRAL